jgi:hypothetical protein
LKVKVYLKSRDKPEAKVFLELDATRSEQHLFENPAMDEVPDKGQPVRTCAPNLTYHAIEAAFQSGVFYAKHRVRTNLHTRLLAFGWEGNLENPIPFAVATTVAIYEAIAGIRDYTETDLSGWDVVAIERE